ncbi:MAG: hypothetical protein ABR604_08730 [Jatrophihabitantaceae bacterium]
MRQPRRPSGSAPWITAAVLGGVALILAGLFVLVIRPAHDRHDSAPKAPGLSGAEQQAVDAGAKQIVNILTFSRKTFEADYARTLAGATGALRVDLEKQKPTLLAQMTTGKFDLEGTVTNSAFEEINGNNSLVLISAQGYKLPAGGRRTLATTARFEVTMTKVDGKWLAGGLQSVGLI